MIGHQGFPLPDMWNIFLTIVDARVPTGITLLLHKVRMTNSTRRFILRSSSVPFVKMGLVSP